MSIIKDNDVRIVLNIMCDIVFTVNNYFWIVLYEHAYLLCFTRKYIHDNTYKMCIYTVNYRISRRIGRSSRYPKTRDIGVFLKI